jgi:beta-glucosidase
MTCRRFEDYSMSNRTYRYFSGQPLFAFGHGLSYTKFELLRRAKLDAATSRPCGCTIKLSFTDEKHRKTRRR